MKKKKKIYKPEKGVDKKFGKVHAPTKRPHQNQGTFNGFVKKNIPDDNQKIPESILRSSPLASLDYADELKIKDDSLAAFWKYHKLPGSPETVIPSPRPRKYRTTTKRRTAYKSGKLFLFFGDKKAGPSKKPFEKSPLEPFEHSEIYRFLQKKLSEPPYKIVATHLNFLIIRGNYREHAVIFNVDIMNGPLVRKLKMLTELMKGAIKKLSGVYIYPDPTGSDYYLEGRRPADLLHFKKLFGSPYLKVSYGSSRYHFHPTSFSQVNESVAAIMLEKAQELLNPSAGEVLIDLFCGYGLFSHYLASNYKQVIGVDAEGPSIRSAIANKKLNSSSKNAQFKARRINAEGLEAVLPPSLEKKETIIIDPPRQGPSFDVYETLAERKPHSVLHVFCGVDQIPDAVKAWQRNGYTINNIFPLDMFPGSANLEVLILLTPAVQKTA